MLFVPIKVLESPLSPPLPLSPSPSPKTKWVRGKGKGKGEVSRNANSSRVEQDFYHLMYI